MASWVARDLAPESHLNTGFVRSLLKPTIPVWESQEADSDGEEGTVLIPVFSGLSPDPGCIS